MIVALPICVPPPKPSQGETGSAAAAEVAPSSCAAPNTAASRIFRQVREMDAKDINSAALAMGPLDLKQDRRDRTPYTGSSSAIPRSGCSLHRVGSTIVKLRLSAPFSM